MTFFGLSFLWESTHPALMAKNACNGGNGEKSPEGWRFKLDAKSGFLESGNFGENGEISGHISHPGN